MTGILDVMPFDTCAEHTSWYSKLADCPAGLSGSTLCDGPVNQTYPPTSPLQT